MRLPLRGLLLGATAVLLAGGPRTVSAECCSVSDCETAVEATGSAAGADSVCVLEISGITCGACAAHVQKAAYGARITSKGVPDSKSGPPGNQQVSPGARAWEPFSVRGARSSTRQRDASKFTPTRRDAGHSRWSEEWGHSRGALRSNPSSRSGYEPCLTTQNGRRARRLGRNVRLGHRGRPEEPTGTNAQIARSRLRQSERRLRRGREVFE